jgi:ketol-acid reductoisomerase
MEITLAGFGNQGKAWAANLQDSGWSLSVLAGPEGHPRAQAAGFSLSSKEEAWLRGGLVAILWPDEKTPTLFPQAFPQNRQGPPTVFVFAHGFAPHFNDLPLRPEDSLILVAPKGIGSKLRENYLRGSGVLGVLAVGQDPSGQGLVLARQVAEGLGLHRVGLVEATIAEETQADLLSEQMVLCGLLPTLVEATEEFLVKQGVRREVAHYECADELELIAAMIRQHGVAGMQERISRAAFRGGERGRALLGGREAVEAALGVLWQEILSGSFAKHLGRIEGQISKETGK